MLSARLQLRQSQSLALTPQLLQSIRLLQYSHGELQAFVDGEIERNPFLGRPDDVPGRGSGSAIAAPARRGGTQASAFGTVPDERPSLYRHALAEVADTLRCPRQRRIGDALAGHLDEAGYLRCETADVAASLGAAPEAVETVLAQLQAGVEPAGLFARDLAECLAIQLRRRDRFDPVMATILGNLALLAQRDFAALRRLTGESEATLMEILAEVRALDPKPGHGFDHAAASAITPDVTVAPAPDGSWGIKLNASVLPRVLVNETYAATVGATRSLPKQEQTFLTECQASANWLVRALDQRARTILKVAAEIVKRQDDFLRHGIASLKPMTLMSVAQSIGMHESTVSRVTANKFMATPRGSFEMKFFFTVAIAATDGGNAHSAASVRHRIRSLIAAETADAVLSDDDVADRLRMEGIDLARRTVAKYRESLGIASSIQRRREINACRLAS